MQSAKMINEVIVISPGYLYLTLLFLAHLKAFQQQKNAKFNNFHQNQICMNK